ncbi:MAG: hypothetical protein J7J05_06100 [Thermococcus sp.]|uniref:hypothetical protein n=1 Tax=Thermococcus sp. TaxID=35749 RepID=UPI000F18B20C|nr:hypothetical protein [Thermococcus sp.]RLF75868.1 MAG: hypothetical protein DRN51_03175 [Thermococci archaeon]MCD6140487.1 hypothetical protein [Thermococcus sp.]MCD6143066.1 hypothetical protein [Thermococcus sp.]RLF77599.1 MAG: hypothetical protein DRN38_08135 [Thermococci archaeon]RLF83053.1 MAG: hypothetical protein DRN48_08290 [Thermococci archaeon]
MSRCPLCGEVIKWEDLVEQMLVLSNFQELLKDKDSFLSALNSFAFKCPKCGEEFYGNNLNQNEASKVFELLNEFNGSIDYENNKVRLKLTNLLALDLMLEEWDKRVKTSR